MARKALKTRKQQELVAPTNEQMAQASYRAEPITERGQVVSVAFRRVPYYQRLHETGVVDDEQMAALHWYANLHAAAQMGMTRCSLAQDTCGHGGHGPSERLLLLRHFLKGIEAQLPSDILAMIYWVVLDERDFSDIARSQYALRHDQKPSGHQRRTVQAKFMQALNCLCDAVAPYISTTDFTPAK